MQSKHRVRMAKIYQVADVQNLMVVGAANRTEWMTGNFCQWGIDHCADVMPIEDDKGKLLGGFQLLDGILSDMEAGMPLEQLNQSYDPSLVQRAMLMNKYSRHMRESPYHL